MDQEPQNQKSRESLHRSMLWIFVVIAVIAVIVAMAKISGRNSSAGGNFKILESITSKDWVMGTSTDPEVLTLTEYSDFQCPACALYNELLVKYYKDIEANVRFVYRHFPLPQHLNAKLAIQAAEAAGKQGKFWQMHDMLFDKQKDWEDAKDPTATFEGYAKGLKLDLEKFKKDFNSNEIKTKIEDSVVAGRELKLNQTPTFFINNTKIENFKDEADFIKLVFPNGTSTKIK